MKKELPPAESGAPPVKTSKTIREVERMVALGLDKSEISYVLGISIVTLEQQYGNELTHGTAATISKVGAALLKSALRGDTNAAQFFLRARARWVTPTKAEHDVNVTVHDKRKLMDDIVSLVAAQQHKDPAQIKQLLAAQPTGKPS